VTYLLLKHLHVACVVVSGTGFTARCALAMTDSPLAKARFARIAPHVVDTLLLASAIGLASMRAEWPFQTGWLTAKLCGLFAYVALGTLALRFGRKPAIRAVFGLAALAVFAWIVSVAVLKLPTGFLGGL